MRLNTYKTGNLWQVLKQELRATALATPTYLSTDANTQRSRGVS